MRKLTSINDLQLEKFGRQIILKEIGLTGQLKIMNSSVLIIGCGGLGTSALIYLAMTGLNNIGIIDYDKVSLSNLNRQLLFKDKDIGKSKVEIAAKIVRDINPEVNLMPFNKKLNSQNINKIIRDFSIILDCSDNFKTRYLVNRKCHEHKKILISSALHNFEIQLFNFKSWFSSSNPCYECIFPQNKITGDIGNCNDLGIISPIAGFGGILQAISVIKIIINKSKEMFNNFTIYDGLNMNQKIISIKKNSDCSICKKN